MKDEALRRSVCASCCADSVVVISGMDGHEQLHLFLPCDLWVLVSPSSLSHGFSLSLHVSGTCSGLLREHSSNGARTGTPSTLPGEVRNMRRTHTFFPIPQVYSWCWCFNMLPELTCGSLHYQLLTHAKVHHSIFLCVKKRGTGRIESWSPSSFSLFCTNGKDWQFPSLQNTFRIESNSNSN